MSDFKYLQLRLAKRDVFWKDKNCKAKTASENSVSVFREKWLD